MDKTDLIDLLNKYEIKTDQWLKTPSMLSDEIKEGSSVLIKKNNKLIRKVSIAVIFCSDDKIKYFAEKVKLIFTEKILKNEKPVNGCRRGLKEELGLIDKKDYGKITAIGKYEEKKDSYSYKGLTGYYKYYAFFIQINRYPDLLHIDHDGKQLEFVKIDLNEFNFPNNYFIKKLKSILNI